LKSLTESVLFKKENDLGNQTS